MLNHKPLTPMPKLLEEFGFELWHTGGGCMAYGWAGTEGTTEIYVTSAGGGTHLDEGLGIMMGFYFEDHYDFSEEKTFIQFEDYEELETILKPIITFANEICSRDQEYAEYIINHLPKERLGKWLKGT
jgi:hypothetical protein